MEQVCNLPRTRENGRLQTCPTPNRIFVGRVSVGTTIKQRKPADDCWQAFLFHGDLVHGDLVRVDLVRVEIGRWIESIGVGY